MCLRLEVFTKIWPWTIKLRQSTKYQNYKPGLVLSTKRKCSQFLKGEGVQGPTFFHPEVTHLCFHFKIQYNGVA